MRGRRLLLALAGAVLCSVGAGAAMTGIAAGPAIPEERAEQVALDWVATRPGPAPGPWTVTRVGPASVPAGHHLFGLPWVPGARAAWEVELQGPGGQARVVVDRRDGRVISSFAATA